MTSPALSTRADTISRPRPYSLSASAHGLGLTEVLPRSVTSIRTPSGQQSIGIVNVPPRSPLGVYLMALAANSPTISSRASTRGEAADPSRTPRPAASTLPTPPDQLTATPDAPSAPL